MGQIRLKVRTEFQSILDEYNINKGGQQEITQTVGLDDSLAERIVSRPSSGQRQVYNIIYDVAEQELIFEISEQDT